MAIVCGDFLCCIREVRKYATNHQSHWLAEACTIPSCAGPTLLVFSTCCHSVGILLFEDNQTDNLSVVGAWCLEQKAFTVCRC